MMIDICSDLHVDGWMGQTILHDPNRKMWMGEPFESTFLYLDWAQLKNPGSQILVIAGDVSNNLITTSHVLEAAAAEYEHVVFIEGNHDHYENDMNVENGAQLLKTLIAQWPNVHHLDGTNSLVLNGTVFLGATGWYDWKCFEDQGISEIIARVTWKQYSNDSRYPSFAQGTPEKIAMVHAVNLAEQVRAFTVDPAVDNIVMTTHMSPRGDLMVWKNDPVWNALTPSYVNSALSMVTDADVNGKISHWIYGHTHHRQMEEKDGILYINNARGYPRENPPFSLTQVDVSAK